MPTKKKYRSFVSRNFLENVFYNMSRGQINHIGHILNPINEYMLGKPIKEIYFQYGIGNTFIMKWTMELFGGISIENYYKCYIFYLIYFMTFLLMLFVLFEAKTVTYYVVSLLLLWLSSIRATLALLLLQG